MEWIDMRQIWNSEGTLVSVHADTPNRASSATQLRADLCWKLINLASVYYAHDKGDTHDN
jgi:hypothetical protein